MKRTTAVSCIMVGLTGLLAGSSLADDVPFAERTAGSRSEIVSNSLGDLMELMQYRHIKIWYAGSNNNWSLLTFEAARMRQKIKEAALLYENIPVDYIIALDRALTAIDKAAETQDRSKFMQGFAELTSACNSCHRAAQVGFIIIQTPTRSPFSDQDFEVQSSGQVAAPRQAR